MKIKYMLIVVIVFITLSINIKNKTFNIENKKVYNNNDNIEILEKYGYVSGYTCNKITVLNEDGTYQGRYNFEDYIAGVVSGETHQLDDEGLFLAISVAARTYALYVTNNCRYPIMNSEAHQVMDNPNIVSKKIRNAVAKTKGQILTINGKIFMSEYDAFYTGSGFYCDKDYCYSNYKKVGLEKGIGETHKIKVPASWYDNLIGGHGNGLSQYGAKYLSQQGYNYQEILKYFYDDNVKISTTIKPNIDGLVKDENFITRNTRPLRNNPFYYKNNEVSNDTLEGESTWYTTSRSNEILMGIDSNKRISYFDDSSKYCNLINFEKSNDYTKPKVGSIISWGKHSAIVEKVYEDSIDITESYIGLGYYGVRFSNEYLLSTGKFYNKNTNIKDRKYNCEQNKSGCFKRSNIKINDLKNRWGYNFKCYVYLID